MTTPFESTSSQPAVANSGALVDAAAIRCHVFIATSLDGFIARNDGQIDWLDTANQGVTPGEDCGFHAFMQDVDVLVMGRNTFELVLTFDGWPYGDTRLVVMTSRELVLPDKVPPTVSVTAESPRSLVARLEREGVKKVYVDGGLTIQSFLKEGLIDELIITRIPVLLGSGKALFGAVPSDVWLEHVSTQAYPFGFVQSRYRVKSG